jgi:hypothetical protein
VITSCTFSRNAANYEGGGLCLYGNSHAVITNCTFSGNAAPRGGGIGSYDSSHPILENSIIAFSTAGEAFSCESGSGPAGITCCDFFGNAGGDWVGGYVAGYYGTNGNIAEDPLFCSGALGSYRIDLCSPCAPFSEPNPECGLIGAWLVGCPYTPAGVVRPDGSGDHPTIQAAVDSVGNWAIIELTNGVFQGEGNRDIDFLGKAITIRSQTGDPDSCIIDCLGDSLSPHRGFTFQSGETSHSILAGVTITKGYSSVGGAVNCRNASSPRIERCVLASNQASERGGGMNCASSSSPAIVGCTICANAAPMGSGISSVTNAAPILENTIIAFGVHGQAIYCAAYSGATLACCDLYGNAGGDWVGSIAEQYGVNGNFSLDPFFCDPENGDYHLFNYSSCRHQQCCGQVGALPMGCTDPQAIFPREPDAHLVLAATTPNPFTTSTHIAYAIPDPAWVSLAVHDAGGRLVRTLIAAMQPAGRHTVCWRGGDNLGRQAEAGVYFCRLSVGEETLTRRVLLVK